MEDLIEITQATIPTLPDHFGVYKIYAYQKNVDEPVIIRRFIKDDITGLVYIGMSHKQSLRKRLNNFEISLRKDKTRNHTAAIKLWDRHSLQELRQCRFFVWCSNELKEELAKDVERIQIESYVSQFGESPLLNG